MKTVGTTVLNDLWALEWVCHPAKTNFRSARRFTIPKYNTLFNSAPAGWENKKCKYCSNNKEHRYSRVPRLSDTRYSANGNKGKWRIINIDLECKQQIETQAAKRDRQQSEIVVRHLPLIASYVGGRQVMWAVDRVKRYGRQSGRGCVRVGVACSRNELALGTKLTNLNLK